jgi:hypothetical protein
MKFATCNVSCFELMNFTIVNFKRSHDEISEKSGRNVFCKTGLKVILGV